ncbi:MAG: hypothetical protein U1E13_05410 [Methylophilaceae bacterium]|nr:hypothetical protein [Methylophilaceae bacterium]
MSNKLSKSVTYIAYLLIIMAVMMIGWYYYRLFTNPLPKDEELIAHFQAHRGEFEELVKRYREYEPEQVGMHHLWKEQGDTPQLLKRAGVKRFSDNVGIWIPNPYSNDYKARSDVLFEQQGMEWMSSKYGNIQIYLDDPRYFTPSFSKNLLHFPEIPRIKQGVLIGPGVDEEKQIANPFSGRVRSSLNDAIPEKGYCALRQLEPQWFIKLCHF